MSPKKKKKKKKKKKRQIHKMLPCFCTTKENKKKID